MAQAQKGRSAAAASVAVPQPPDTASDAWFYISQPPTRQHRLRPHQAPGPLEHMQEAGAGGALAVGIDPIQYYWKTTAMCGNGQKVSAESPDYGVGCNPKQETRSADECWTALKAALATKGLTGHAYVCDSSDERETRYNAESAQYNLWLESQKK